MWKRPEIFDAESGRERFATEGAHRALVSAIHYLPDGAGPRVGDDGTIRLWDCQSRASLTWSATRASVIGWRFRPMARNWHRSRVAPECRAFASGSAKRGDWCGSGWATRPRTHRQPWRFRLTGKELLCFSHKQGLKAIEVETGRERAIAQPRFLLDAADRSEQSLAQCKFSPDTRYLATCTGVTTHVVELASGVERFSFPSYAMAFHPRGTGIAVACEEQRDPVAFSDAGKTVMVELLPLSLAAERRSSCRRSG